MQARERLQIKHDKALAVLREIEAACSIPATAIINNSNLGAETSAEDVLATAAECEELCRLSGLPLAMTGVRAELRDAVPGAFALHLQKRLVD